MDKEQFDTFMSTLTLLLKQLQDKKSDSPVNIAPFENFDSKREKFSCYLERFENYYTMKGVTDETKITQLFCTSIGSVHYNKLSSFLGPDKIVKDLGYDDLIKSFKLLLVPKKNVIVTQHYFLNSFQKNGQSIADFVADLQRDIVDCGFTVKCECDKTISIADNFLRAQFVRGIRDDWLREHLLQSNLDRFRDIVEKATSLEASRIESREISQRPCSFDPQPNLSDTNKVSSSFRDTSSNRFSSKKRFSKPDYKALGIENLCIRCGKTNHKVNECRIERNNLKCYSCKKQGHVAKVCLTTLLKTKRCGNTHSKATVNTVSDQHLTSNVSFEINNLELISQSKRVVDLFEVMPGPDKYIVNVSINGSPQTFEVDSGAKFSLLGESDYNKLNLDLPLEVSNIIFKSYSGDLIQPKGKVTVNVEYNGKVIIGELHIVPSGHSALLGRLWIRNLGIELKQVYEEMMNSSMRINLLNEHSIEDMFKNFSYIFEEKIGCVPNFKVSLQLRPGAKPIFTREREVPYALRERVDKELDSLEKNGIITLVSTSDWGSPLVVIPKADQGVRLCVDYKCGVNDRLVKASHPIRRIDDILNSLRNSRYFCKLDLYKAYLHLQVDEDSSNIQTISTHRGTYRMNRLSFGIKTAPSEFNRILSQIFKGIPKTESYFDDIIVHGSTLEECAQNLQYCLQRLSDYDLHLNKQKCSFFKEKVAYLGYVVEHNQIRKSPDKIKAIQEMPRPVNADDVRRFLGLITYYARFIPNLSSTTYPLRSLLKKGERWSWTSKCESTFLKLKAELCSDRVLVPFDPTLPLLLTTDASPSGVAAVLSHIVDGIERPISYASRSLNPSEQNYSQLDREALAIVFGVNHFYNYLFGKHFTLITDNEPLTRIFHHQKALPQMTSARLLRYASFLAGFDYNVQYKKGKDNQNCDCLSRASIKQSSCTVDEVIGEEVNMIYAQTIFQISNDKITSVIIREETKKDQNLQKIVNDLTKTSNDSEFTLFDGILFRKNRVLIPVTLRPAILKELHETHLGMTKMKQLSRCYVYWPGIDRDIESLVKGCEKCALTRANPPKVPVHPWILPDNNWERIHVDYAGPFDNFYFFVCVDAKSKWAEIKTLTGAPSSTNTIDLLENIFATHGYPKEMVSDNASIFTSEEFHNYCKNSGIVQKFIAPGHPATNGLAERNVQTLKNKLKSVSNENMSMQKKVRNIMFRYRATPLACGQSPAELYLHRKIRIRLDAIFPHQSKTTLTSFKEGRFFQEGERVQIRFFINNKYVWKFGNITKVLGKRHYIVQLDDGRKLKRHVNQLCSTNVPKYKQTDTFGPTQSFNVPGVSSIVPSTPPIIQIRNELDPTADPQITRPQRDRRPPLWLRDYQV